MIQRWWPTTQSLDLVEGPVEAVAAAVHDEVHRCGGVRLHVERRGAGARAGRGRRGAARGCSRSRSKRLGGSTDESERLHVGATPASRVFEGVRILGLVAHLRQVVPGYERESALASMERQLRETDATGGFKRTVWWKE